jgi:Fcf2 pre-rRNA processing
VFTGHTKLQSCIPSHTTLAHIRTQVHANKDQSAVAGGGKSAGNGWFNVVGSEQTAELKRDAELIRMRGYMDPKRFYKAPEVCILMTVFMRILFHNSSKHLYVL